MRTLALALLALLAALALAGAAQAAERVATFPANGRSPVAGPVPTGGEVAYGHRLASGRWWLGTTARTLAVLPAPGIGLQANVYLAGSPQRAAWVRTVEPVRQGKLADPPVEDRLFSLRPPGESRLVDACPIEARCRRYFSAYRFAVDGPLLAWLRQDTPDPSTLTIDRGDGSPPRRIEIDDPEVDFAGPVAAAGGRVAYAATDSSAFSEGTSVRVVGADGRELLRVDSSPDLTFGGDRSWALQPDGKLVIWTRQGLAWLSPQEPSVHPIPTPPVEWHAIVGAAGDRVAYLDQLPVTYEQRLRVLDLDGGARTLATFRSSFQNAGFDGTTVAWAALRCDVVSIWTAPADGSGTPWEDDAGACPGFDARRPLLGRTRAVARLQCPRGCRGSVSLALAGAPRRRLARRRVAFRASQRARVVRLALDRGDRRALREAWRFGPPVVLQRFAGRDGTGEQVVAERKRSLRPVG